MIKRDLIKKAKNHSGKIAVASLITSGTVAAGIVFLPISGPILMGFIAASIALAALCLLACGIFFSQADETLTVLERCAEQEEKQKRTAAQAAGRADKGYQALEALLNTQVAVQVEERDATRSRLTGHDNDLSDIKRELDGVKRLVNTLNLAHAANDAEFQPAANDSNRNSRFFSGNLGMSKRSERVLKQ